MKLVWASSALPAWQAFQLQIYPQTKQMLVVEFKIAAGYHLYQNKIKIQTLATSPVRLAKAQLPSAHQLNSPSLGALQVYDQELVIQVPISNYANGKLSLQINYQGCKGLSLCYPEQQVIKELDLNQLLTEKTPITNPDSGFTFAKSLTNLSALLSAGSGQMIANSMAGNLFWLCGLFFALGILLAFTPCVFPLLPILLSLLVGKGLTTTRSVVIAFSYVLGGAVIYALAGVFAASLGYSLAASLQTWWVLAIIVVLFVLFALSLFGLFSLQLPLAWQNTLNRLISRRGHNSLVASFFIGAIANLILSPCVTAPLVGALIYIASTGNYLLGGLALFSLGIGSGIPLLILVVFGARLLPKSGAWMILVKKILAMLMLLVAIYMLSKLLTWQWIIYLLMLWFIGLIVIIGIEHKPIGKIRYLMMLLLGLVVMYVGINYTLSLATVKTQPIQFVTVSKLEQLDELLAKAKQNNQAVILDYYASWCVACHEMEERTFTDSRLKQRLTNYIKIRVDVSKNDKQAQLLQQRYQIIAPPSLVFIDGNGQVASKYTITGFINSDELSKTINDFTHSSCIQVKSC